jgi:hypothetical protein
MLLQVSYASDICFENVKQSYRVNRQQPIHCHQPLAAGRRAAKVGCYSTSKLPALVTSNLAEFLYRWSILAALQIHAALVTRVNPTLEKFVRFPKLDNRHYCNV